MGPSKWMGSYKTLLSAGTSLTRTLLSAFREFLVLLSISTFGGLHFPLTCCRPLWICSFFFFQSAMSRIITTFLEEKQEEEGKELGSEEVKNGLYLEIVAV